MTLRHVLLDDTTGLQSSVSPAAAGNSPPLLTGQYYFCNSAGNTSTNGALGVGTVRVSAWFVSSTITVSAMAAEFTVAGDAASIFRIGVWNDNGNGQPSSLLFSPGSISTGTGNAGTVATAGTPNVYAITGLTQVVPPGLYWVGGAVQGVTTTQPTLRCPSSNCVWTGFPQGTSLPAAALAPWGFLQTGFAGALSTLNAPVAGNGGVRLLFKC
jgi:hypothetical protein